jgi:hypothetical protein
MEGEKADGGAGRCRCGRWLRRRGLGSWLGGVRVVSERACSPPAPARCGYRATRGPGAHPRRWARFRSSRCRRLWSARVRCGGVSRTAPRSALSCTGVHGPPGALTRAHSAAAAAISRHAAAAAGVGVGAPRSTWSLSAAAKGLSQRREARRTAARRARSSRAVARTPAIASRRVSQKSAPERRNRPLGCGHRGTTRVGPGVDAGRRQLDTLGRRIAPVAHAWRETITVRRTRRMRPAIRQARNGLSASGRSA